MIRARLKYIIKTQKGKVPKTFSDDNSHPPYLSMDYLRGDISNILYVKPKEEYKLVDENEVLVLWDGANAGEVMFSKKGFISSTMAIVTPKVEYFEKRFLFYFLKSIEGELKKASTGTTIPHLDQNFLFNTHFEFPEVEIQKPIADYLDTQSAKITHFIQTKQRFIELLKEQRQSIITNAVTKGIDENVKMKETVLGQIPEHWKHTAIKRLVKTKITDGPHETPKMTNEGISFVSAEAAVNGRIELSKMRCYISPKLHQEYCKKVKPMNGDIFMVKSGSTTGKVVIVDFDDEFSVWSPLALVRPIDSINNEFLFYAMSSNYFQREVQLNWSFGTQPNIGMAKMEQLNVAFPTTIEEQKQIVEHIKTETKTLDIAISKAEREIELIKEYREAMIAEAVTGKMKL